MLDSIDEFTSPPPSFNSCVARLERVARLKVSFIRVNLLDPCCGPKMGAFELLEFSIKSKSDEESLFAINGSWVALP